MDEIIKKLIDMGLKFNSDELETLKTEINSIGYQKMHVLLKYKKDFKYVMKLYISDMRLSTFFWKHIRRLEIELNSILINYFSGDKNIKLIDSKVKEIQRHTQEGVCYTAEEKRYNPSLEFLNAETEYGFALVSDLRKKNIYTQLSKVISGSNKSTEKLNVSSVIKGLSLGKTVDLVNILSSPDILLSLEKFEKMSNLTTLRNQISHFHLLSDSYNANDLREFWKIIKDMSATNEKTTKNDIKFNSLILEYDI